MNKHYGVKGVKVAIVCLLILSVTAAFSPAAADLTGFTASQQTGNWDSSTLVQSSRNTLGNYETGTKNWDGIGTVTVANESGGLFGVRFHLDELIGNRVQWYWIDGKIAVYFVVDVYNGNEHLYAWFYVSHTTGMFGNSAELRVGNQGTAVAIHGAGATGGGGTVSLPLPQRNYVATGNATYDVQFQRVSNVSTVVRYTYVKDFYAPNYFIWNHMVFNETLANSASFWSGASVKISYGYEGIGKFSFGFPDFQSVESPTTYDPEQTAADNLEKNTGFGGFTWGFLGDLVNWIGQGFLLITTVLQSAGGVLLGIVPMLPYIFIIYLLDALMTSIVMGSFSPIGFFFSMLWGIVVQAFNFMVALGSLVWDVVTFWS